MSDSKIKHIHDSTAPHTTLIMQPYLTEKVKGRRHEAAAREIRRGFETSKLVQACWRALDIKLPCKVTFKDTCKVQESQVYLTLAWGVTLQD